ncbi:hypothetical protein RN001_013666 [Aquatica leii]|uniref:MADF domain-containing protein n=1 Tax=Aquatica leii TaxID=1421715 RepID=A0AAN7S755_9COLE|nr:hypothetical protein RN001_013666 [Aquatica leii]
MVRKYLTQRELEELAQNIDSIEDIEDEVMSETADKLLEDVEADNDDDNNGPDSSSEPENQCTSEYFLDLSPDIDSRNAVDDIKALMSVVILLPESDYENVDSNEDAIDDDYSLKFFHTDSEMKIVLLVLVLCINIFYVVGICRDDCQRQRTFYEAIPCTPSPSCNNGTCARAYKCPYIDNWPEQYCYLNKTYYKNGEMFPVNYLDKQTKTTKSCLHYCAAAYSWISIIPVNCPSTDIADFNKAAKECTDNVRYDQQFVNSYNLPIYISENHTCPLSWLSSYFTPPSNAKALTGKYKIYVGKNAECLWNPRDGIYKDRYRKQDIWVEISNAMGAGVDEVKRKIKNLVAQYYREKKKYRAYKKSGAGAYFISKWFAYKYLEFLSDKNLVRHCSEKGIADTNEPHSSNGSEDDDDDDGEKESEIQDIAQSLSEDQLSTQQETHQDNIPSKGDNMDKRDDSVKLQKEKQTSTVTEKPEGKSQTIEKLDVEVNRPKKRRGTQKLNKEADERQEEAYIFLKELQQKQHLKDNFSIFGEHVACKIRRLKTEYAQNTVEHLIGNILWEASTGKYDQPYPFHGAPHLYMPTESPSSSSVTASSPTAYLPSTDTGIASDLSNIRQPENHDDVMYIALSSI